MLELPKRKDFHETTIVEFSNNAGGMYPLKLSQTIQYRKGFVNMRNIVDVFEMQLKFEIIDESKLPEYEKELAVWMKKHQPQRFGYQSIGLSGIENNVAENTNPEVEQYAPPSPVPKKDFAIPVTCVIYFNGVQRMLVDDLKEFSEMYFDYLQAQNLHIN